MTTVTQWFAAKRRPVHVGAYEVACADPDLRKFCWWNGRRWSISHFSPAGAMRCAGFDTPMQFRMWRGLAVKP